MIAASKRSFLTNKVKEKAFIKTNPSQKKLAIKPKQMVMLKPLVINLLRRKRIRSSRKMKMILMPRRVSLMFSKMKMMRTKMKTKRLLLIQEASL